MQAGPQIGFIGSGIDDNAGFAGDDPSHARHLDGVRAGARWRCKQHHSGPSLRQAACHQFASELTLPGVNAVRPHRPPTAQRHAEQSTQTTHDKLRNANQLALIEQLRTQYIGTKCLQRKAKGKVLLQGRRLRGVQSIPFRAVARIPDNIHAAIVVAS